MAELGKTQTLLVSRDSPIGVFLDAGRLGEVLLPRREVPQECEVGSELEVFLYTDSEDRTIATTRRPRAHARGQQLCRLRLCRQTQWASGGHLQTGTLAE